MMMRRKKKGDISKKVLVYLSMLLLYIKGKSGGFYYDVHV